MGQRDGDHYPDYSTPQHIYDALDRRFHFTFDAAASEDNTKCARYWTKEDNALLQPWGRESYFCNPPYNTGLLGWTDKYMEALRAGGSVVGIHPNTTEAAWFEYCFAYGTIWLARPRIQFNSAKSGNTLGTVIVILGHAEYPAQRMTIWNWQEDFVW